MEPGDYVVNTKKRYDRFVATDLDFMLRRHGINTLLITGINTSSCVLATAIRANVLDYAPVIMRIAWRRWTAPRCTTLRWHVCAQPLAGFCEAMRRWMR